MACPFGSGYTLLLLAIAAGYPLQQRSSLCYHFKNKQFKNPSGD